MKRRAAGILILAACSDPSGSARSKEGEPPSPAPAAKLPSPPLLPVSAGPLWPSEATTKNAPGGGRLAETADCEGCHADVAASWRSSAHAAASFDNPIYRASVERLRAARGREPSRFCGGCHDPALLIDGALDAEVSPADPRATAGITCRTCHGIASTTGGGNGGYELDGSPVPFPRPGDPESLARHRARVAPPSLRDPATCISCHRVTLGPQAGNAHTLPGQDEGGAWRRSAYAGSRAERVDPGVSPRTCAGCHMPREDAALGDSAAKHGRIASHRFLGGHTFLGAMRGDPAAVEASAAFLRGAASVAIPRARAERRGREPEEVLLFDPSAALTILPVAPGDALILTVVVRNEAAGHKFPAGTLDAQDVWLRVVVTDARGTVLGASGTSPEEPDAHRFLARIVGSDGAPRVLRETHEFEAVAYDTTIGARDAVKVDYRLALPQDLSLDRLPLSASVTLRHRSRSRVLSDDACRETRSARGLAFAAHARGLRDGCVPEPITDVASASVRFGEGAPPVVIDVEEEAVRAVDSATTLGMASLHALSEKLDAARPALAWAARHAGSDAERGRALSLLADLDAKEGATDRALDEAAEAEARLGPHPTLDRIRGDALLQALRYPEAAAAYRRAVQAAPGDDQVRAKEAIAAASAGEAWNAWTAAGQGLALVPRDSDLLRVQALSLAELGAPHDEQETALDAYLAHRSPDAAARLRGRCAATVPGCRLERIPGHEHVLGIPATAAPSR